MIAGRWESTSVGNMIATGIGMCKSLARQGDLRKKHRRAVERPVAKSDRVVVDRGLTGKASQVWSRAEGYAQQHIVHYRPSEKGNVAS